MHFWVLIAIPWRKINPSNYGMYVGPIFGTPKYECSNQIQRNQSLSQTGARTEPIVQNHTSTTSSAPLDQYVGFHEPIISGWQSSIQRGFIPYSYADINYWHVDRNGMQICIIDINVEEGNQRELLNQKTKNKKWSKWELS